MVEGSEGDVIDYLMKSNKGEILKRGDRESNKLKIGETTYSYNKNKPITDKSTIDYKRYELVEKKQIIWLKVDKNKALQSYQKKI